ncbi:MAG TPA: hypothetical protein VJH04_00090 [archaeon]|nr:hypothetical protein [archaeon]
MEYVHYIPAVIAALVPVITNMAAGFSIKADIKSGVERSRIAENYFGGSFAEKALTGALFGVGYAISMRQRTLRPTHSNSEKQYCVK